MTNDDLEVPDFIRPARWECWAHPVALGGKRCGHINRGDPLMSNGMECCKGCGATKKASDDRRRRASA